MHPQRKDHQPGGHAHRVAAAASGEKISFHLFPGLQLGSPMWGVVSAVHKGPPPHCAEELTPVNKGQLVAVASGESVPRSPKVESHMVCYPPWTHLPDIMESHLQFTNILVLTMWKQTLLPGQLPQNQTKEVGKKTKEKVKQSFILLKLFIKWPKKKSIWEMGRYPSE